MAGDILEAVTIMVHARFRFPSRALGRNLEFHALLPRPQSQFTDAAASMELGKKKSLWFFHGVGDNAETVLLRTDLAGLCDEHDLIVLLPSVENSFCLDVSESLRWREALAEELIPYADAVFGLSQRREDRLIGGISMGGYGACQLGLTLPGRFGKIFCLSGALDLRTAVRFSRACGISLPEPLTEKGVEARADWDLPALLERTADRPEIYLVCSEMDSVYRSNVRFARRAEELGYAVERRTAPGLHDWAFWAANLPAAVAWAVKK